MASKLQDLLSQSWYECKYVLLGRGQKKQVDEFLEDNKDFIDAVHREQAEQESPMDCSCSHPVYNSEDFLEHYCVRCGGHSPYHK